MDALHWTLLVCMCLAIALLFKPRHRHDGEESPIAFFRCISCDQLVKGLRTPFNTRKHPCCNSCAVKYFPDEAYEYYKTLQQKAPH